MRISSIANIIGGLNSKALIKSNLIQSTEVLTGKLTSEADIESQCIIATALFTNKITACAVVINSGVSECPEDRFDTVLFDVTNDTLPITTDNETNFLTVEFSNFDADLDVTGSLPTNIRIGARVTLRKVDSTIHRLIFDEGTVNYRFINKKGEYLELYWTGTKYII